jgi:hypothetical protein
MAATFQRVANQHGDNGKQAEGGQNVHTTYLKVRTPQLALFPYQAKLGMSLIGTFRTSSDVRSMVAIRAKADIERLDPEMVPRRRTLR